MSSAWVPAAGSGALGGLVVRAVRHWLVRVGRAEPSRGWDIGARAGVALVTAVVLAGLVCQYALFAGGLVRLSADESARSLMAHRLTWANAAEPWIWPPFYKVFVGLLLKMYDDLVVVPRLAVAAFGALTVVGTAALAVRLFHNRLIGVVAACLAAFLPQRMILSILPLSEIFFYGFVVWASACLVAWLRTDAPRHLILTSVGLFLASTVRYEGCFFSLVLLAHVAYRFLFVGDINRWLAAVSAGILLLFPVSWMSLSLLYYGSLQNLAITSQQYADAFGIDYWRAVRKNQTTLFAVDLVAGPALALGMAALLIRSARDRVLRTWAIIVFASLAAVTAWSFISFSLPAAMPWRTSGVWALLLVPWAALALWAAVEPPAGGRRRLTLLAGVVVLALVPFAVRTLITIAPAFRPAHRSYGIDSVRAGQAAARLIAGDDRMLLVDSVDQYDYLDVIAASKRPDRCIVTAREDPLAVAIWMMGRRKYYRERRTDIIERYLKDKYALASDPDVAAMRADRIGYLAVRSVVSIARLDSDARFERFDRIGRWALYRLP